jgi:hypothetical protein
VCDRSQPLLDWKLAELFKHNSAISRKGDASKLLSLRLYDLAGKCEVSLFTLLPFSFLHSPSPFVPFSEPFMPTMSSLSLRLLRLFARACLAEPSAVFPSSPTHATSPSEPSQTQAVGRPPSSRLGSRLWRRSSRMRIWRSRRSRKVGRRWFKASVEKGGKGTRRQRESCSVCVCLCLFLQR